MTNPPNPVDGVAENPGCDDCSASTNTAPARPATQPAAIHRMIPAWVLAVLLLGGEVSAKTAQAQVSDIDIEAIAISRAAKDSLFRSSDPNSPIPVESRADFPGLSYFDPDPAYSFEGELHRYGRPRQVALTTNTGSKILFERFGRLFFRFDGKVFWLEIHRNMEVGELSIFFTDETNGDQTYSGGRYARFTALENGTYLIDFNGSYNPYCAYNHSYICPLPPAHNHLPFAVLAGERSFGPNVAYP